MIKAERILIVGSVVFSIFYISLCVYEIVNVRLDVETYSKIYSLNENGLHWQFKSTFNYQFWQGLNMFVAAFVAIAGIKILRGHNLRVVFYSVLIVSVIWFLRYYIFWYQSGFDHYPGFDPYFF